MSPVCIVNGLFADVHITRKVGSGDLRQNFTRKNCNKCFTKYEIQKKIAKSIEN